MRSLFELILCSTFICLYLTVLLPCGATKLLSAHCIPAYKYHNDTPNQEKKNKTYELHNSSKNHHHT